MARRICMFVVIAVLGALTLSSAPASRPGSGTITPGTPQVGWTGGPLTGGAGRQNCLPDARTLPEPAAACDEFLLEVAVPPSYWARHPGGIVVRIEWPGESSELDLSVYNSAGEEVAFSFFGDRSFQQVFVWEPPAGDYRIEVAGFAAQAVTYRGTAALTEQRTPQAPTASNTMTFASTLVDPQLFGLGPGVWADQEDGVFVSAVQGFGTLTSFLWGSSDGGRTFDASIARLPGNVADPRRRPCVESEGGADADVITDRTGRVYFADTQDSGIAIAHSEDQGQNWRCDPLAVAEAEVHRPWLAPAPEADAEGPGIDAYLSYTDFVVDQLPGGNAVRPAEVHVAVTRDGGETWEKASSFGVGRRPWPGPLFVADDGTVYQVIESLHGVWLARSDDQGRTFSLRLVSQRPGRPGGLAFVAGDVDSAGNVYAAWVESGPYDILYSYSTDRGERWSAPVRVNPPNLDTTFLPWLAAGGPGEVAIAWYGTPGRYALPALAPPTARWHTWAARTSHGTTPLPVFQVARISETPVHLGPFGLFGEFMRIAIAPDGGLVASYNDDGRLDALVTDVYVAAARQLTGLGMSASAARAAARYREGAGDARRSEEAPSGGGVSQLDFTSEPSAAVKGDTVRISFELSDAGRLEDAILDPDGAAATDAYWLVLWKANDRLEYAGMHLGASGEPDFFGGDHPVGLRDPEAPIGDFAASYPPMFPLEGTVDAESGRITIEAPLGIYHMKPKDLLHGLQAFSMTGTPPEMRTAHTLLDVVDTTPATSVRLPSPALGGTIPPPAPPKVRGRSTLPATGVGGDPQAILLLVAASLSGALLSRRRSGRGRGNR